jgi:hypothetical protein
MSARPGPHDDLMRIVERSLMARWPASVMRRVDAASRGSRVMHIARAWAASWRAIGRSERLRATGMMLIAAVMVHVTVVSLHRIPAGWMWLVIPGIALAQGLLLVIAGGRWRDSQ